MKPLYYNFKKLEDVFDKMLKTNKCSFSDCKTIRSELNKFFKDAKCNDIIYILNTDKPMFGMRVYSNINLDKMDEYLLDDNNNTRVHDYYIEIDSNLLNPLLAISPREMVAITLHEVGHVVNDGSPIRRAREYLDEYLAKNKETLSSYDVNKFKNLFAYALSDFISKDRSIFYTNNVDEVLADDFVKKYGYGTELERASHAIMRSGKIRNTGNDKVDVFSTFIWTLSVYKNLGTRRISALNTLRRAKNLAATKIEKSTINKLIKDISTAGIYDESYSMSAITETTIANRIKERMRKHKINTLRNLAQDVFELGMRVKNIEIEDDALYIMRQLNTRINLITDFLQAEDIDDEERNEFNKYLEDFKKIRTKLSNSSVYKDKSYGLFIKYPDIKDNNY